MRNILLAVICAALTASTSAQIAYVKNDRLYVLACASSGVPKHGALPLRICRLHLQDADPKEFSLSWSDKGEIEVSALTHWRGKWNGAVKPVSGAKFRAIKADATNYPPEHSPDGSVAIVFTSYPEIKNARTSRWFNDAFLVRTSDHSGKLLVKHAQGFATWSPKGDLVVIPYEAENDNTRARVIAYPSLKTLYEPLGFDPSFAPDGHTLTLLASGALESRPTLFFDLRTGKSIHAPEVAGSWQTSRIEDWSPDRRHFLEIDEAQDEEGYWNKHCVAICDIVSGKAQSLRNTTSAEAPLYSKDGSHFLWIRGKPGRLEVVASAHPNRRTLIATSVTAFGIRR